jgi:hypothetical protein
MRPQELKPAHFPEPGGGVKTPPFLIGIRGKCINSREGLTPFREAPHSLLLLRLRLTPFSRGSRLQRGALDHRSSSTRRTSPARTGF